jgi:hypothetical protein
MQKRPWLWNEQLWRRKGKEDDREGGMVRPLKQSKRARPF